MQCPIDQTPLTMTDRNGIEIDYCPKCRGVWLDRGELDKIIERSAAQAPAPQAQPAPRRDDREYRDRRDDDYRREPYRKKRESFLGELFDF